MKHTLCLRPSDLCAAKLLSCEIVKQCIHSPIKSIFEKNHQTFFMSGDKNCMVSETDISLSSERTPTGHLPKST